MIHYAIELEYFVVNSRNEYIPAHKVTYNLDGNPILGEIRTGIFTDPTDLIFDLKKRIYLEEERLKAKGCKMALTQQVSFSNQQIIELRADHDYINRKNLRQLRELSIYGGKVGKILPRGVFKASLQINVSDNEDITWRLREKTGKEHTFARNVSNIFDYISLLRKFDTAFAADIKRTKRVKGVYAIKPGTLGNRIEYRSLPNDINLEVLLDILKK